MFIRYLLLLLFSAGAGIVGRLTPPVWGWLYEFVTPCATVLVIAGGWRWVSLARKLALLTLALIVGWFADWSLHAITHRPDSALALRAGLILFAIRLAIGIWLLLIWAHFALKDKHANAASNSGPASSGSFQRMTPFETGAILGVIGGAVAGAVLCRSHGMVAEVGGAIGGGVVGLFAGALLVFPISLAYGFARILAKIYWEVLTGRRKLPSMDSQTKAHRRRVLGLIAAIIIVSELLLAGIYFTGSDAQRSRVLGGAGWDFGIGLIGLLILLAMYRRHPAQKEDGNLPAGTQAFADIREYWGYPPRQDQVLEEIFSGDKVGGDWDYAIHIHEGAEQYLGSEQFCGLQKRFASVPGVDECRHEDREVFLIRTKTLNAETLRESCWKQFLEAAKISFEKEGKR